MDGANFYVNLILWLFVMQISTILHELGHALPILAFTQENVKLTLGSGSIKAGITIRRLHVSFKGFAPTVGFMKVEGDIALSKTLSLLLSIGGPLLSFMIGTSAFLVRSYVGEGWLYSILSVTTLYNWFLFVVTAIPIVYPKWWIGYGGYPSDGYRIVRLIADYEKKDRSRLS
jgi:hypothetical protein